MDALEKLGLIGDQMVLEPAEESDSAPRSGGSVNPGIPSRLSDRARPQAAPVGPNAVAACGHSPAELQRMFGSGENVRDVLTPLTQGKGDPAPSLERKKHSLGIYQAVAGGQRVPLLKTLLTSACERDCYYCPFRAGRNFRRATFKPEEMARVFTQMNQANIARGLFLSSGIIGGGVRTQDKLLDTADILRRKLNFAGYIHLKLMPGLERDQLLRAMELADRVSINLEAPNAERLQKLAPHKFFFEELLEPLKWADEIRRTLPPQKTWKGRWPSTVTQLVIGGAGENDLEILTTTLYGLRQLRLQRVYFSAFHPISDTPLENHAPENPWREHRLYQASFLMRDYGFDLEDMPFAADGRLPLDEDPKLGWAKQNLSETPVEVNRASRRDLLRVPGIGPKGVDAILQARRQGKLQELRDLRALGILADRAAPFVLLNGKRPARQLSLFG